MEHVGRTELPTPCMIKFPFAALICTGLRRAGCECLRGTPSGEVTPLPRTFRGRLVKKNIDTYVHVLACICVHGCSCTPFPYQDVYLEQVRIGRLLGAWMWSTSLSKDNVNMTSCVGLMSGSCNTRFAKIEPHRTLLILINRTGKDPRTELISTACWALWAQPRMDGATYNCVVVHFMQIVQCCWHAASLSSSQKIVFEPLL